MMEYHRLNIKGYCVLQIHGADKIAKALKDRPFREAVLFNNKFFGI